MKKILKKIMYTGVGFASLTAERMKKTIDKLVSDGKISEEEGKRIIDDLKKNSEIKKEELEKKIGELSEKLLKSLHLGSSKEMDNLRNRISVLEALLSKK
jgi:polyhydroxyalkanoate synthesis regulator phasin